MAMKPLPNPDKASITDRAEARRRYDLTFNALCHADYLSPVSAYQKQLGRYRTWIKSYDAIQTVLHAAVERHGSHT
jgi:hypothetical protein